jgi:hypothetical protein
MRILVDRVIYQGLRFPGGGMPQSDQTVMKCHNEDETAQ